MKQTLSKAGAVLATGTAFFGSCCALPLLLMSLGMGSMGFAAALVPYQTYLTIATIVLLATAFYLVYGHKQTCSNNEACDIKSIRRTKILLWVATGLALIFFVGPIVIAQFLL